MPSIAIFTPTRSSIKLFYRVYRELYEDGGFTILHYDVVEESGWFEKGVQYVSLDYDKPARVLKYDGDSDLASLVIEAVEKDEPDLALLAGYSEATKEILAVLTGMGVKTIHLEGGLRTYRKTGEELMRQMIDWSSHVNLTPDIYGYKNLVREGFPKTQLYNVGSLLVDTALSNISRADKLSSIIEELELTKNRYIYAYTERINPRNFLEHLGRASIKWDIDIVVPLTKAQKRSLIEGNVYYDLMTKYYLVLIEIQDYLDHLSLINNSRHVITDSSELALETVVLRRGVSIVDGSDDLYRLIDRGMASQASLESLGKLPLDSLRRRGGVDPIKVFGGGESHLRVIDAIDGFIDEELVLPEWNGPVHMEE